MTFIVIAICLLAFAGVLYGSLVPGQYRPRSGLDGHIEHAFAYAVSTATFLPFLSTLQQLLIVGGGMLALAGVLELAQLWIPGRSCRLTHFLASAAGALVPVIAGLIYLLVAGQP
jgi:VanZ family protein